MNRIRFLSFNIHRGRSRDGKNDLRRIYALMERMDVDVGVFQEMETRPSQQISEESVNLLAGPERPHHLCTPCMMEGAGWYGNLIVSRHPIRRGLVHNLETNPRLEPRMAADALIETPHGNLRVIGTHLSLNIFARHTEARNLIRLVRAVEEEEHGTIPIFLMGDINEWQMPSRLLRYLNSVMTPLPCKATFPSYLPILKLDRIWYEAPPNMRVFAHRLKGPGISELSDHLPLLIEIEWMRPNH